MTPEEKQQEEAKRERMYDPVLRWKHIQETITWAEANLPPHLRRNRPRGPKLLTATSPADRS
jgi:hypothetical protein